MKKFTLSIGFLIFFLLLIYSNPLFAQAEDKDQTVFDEAVCYKTCQTAFDECGKSCKTKEYFSEGIDEECISPCREPRRICNLRCYETAIASKKTETPSGPAASLQAKATSCNKIQKILKSKDCPNWAIDQEALQVYCSQNPDELVYIDSEGKSNLAFRNRSPDFAIDQACFDELNQKGFVSGLDTKQPKEDIKEEEAGTKETNNKSNFIGKFFGSNPFQTWLNLRRFAELGAYVYSGKALDDIGPIVSTWYNELKQTEIDARKKAKIGREYLNQQRDRLLRLEGKIGLQDTKKRLDAPLGAPIKAVKEPVIVEQEPATIQVVPLYGKDGVLERNAKAFWELKSGGVDVIVEPKKGEQFQINTPNAEIIVIGTEFSVLYDPTEYETIVAVYKGTVQVRTNNGKTQNLSPDGDKPGVVVVSQKLSVVKLAITGLVLAAVIGGVFLLLKKKFASKVVSKKKR